MILSSHGSTYPEVQPDSRAILLTEVGELGGAERACLALSRWLCEHRIPNHIVTYRDTVGLAQVSASPVPILQLRPGQQASRKVLALRRALLHGPSARAPLASGYQAALHATLAGARGFHCLMHDTPSLFRDRSTPPSPLRRLAERLSDAITGYGLRSGGTTIVTSTFLQAETTEVFGIRPQIARMGGMGSLAGFRSRPHSSPLRMLSVSRVESNKRIDWVLRALATLESGPQPLSQHTPWHLSIVGRGSQLDTMQALAAHLGLATRVRFHGFVSDVELEHLYDAADLFLMPAVQGYGIPAIEALQRGLPVLLHRESGVSDILQDTPWATVFTGGEAELVPALRSALASVQRQVHTGSPLPNLPTEDSWAERVATLCNWL